MLRQGNTHAFHWADKTMSVLRSDQLEACEKELTGLPAVCLFDAECHDDSAEELYDLSWYSEEDRSSGTPLSLHTVDELRVRVLSSFATESALLPSDEHDILIRLTLFGGHYVLQDWEELIPARSLIRRLWCRGDWKDGRLVLHMPHQLCTTALIMLAGDEHRKIREIVETVMDRIDNTLYLTGFMQASAPIHHLHSLLKGTCAENRDDLFGRMLRSTFDYVYDRDRNLTLIHPGLADPDRLIREMRDVSANRSSFRDISSEALSSVSDAIMDLESPLYDRMLSLVSDSVRPELSPEDAVEDLIILAKQDVSITDLKEVLSSMLVSIPTNEMLKSLESISLQTPRWLFFSSSRVQ